MLYVIDKKIILTGLLIVMSGFAICAGNGQSPQNNIKDPTKTINKKSNNDTGFDILFVKAKYDNYPQDSSIISLSKPTSNFPGSLFNKCRSAQLFLLKKDGGLVNLSERLNSNITDILSPSINPEATKIVFAARTKANPHYRLFEVNIDGTNLKQLTGLEDDLGCLENPYLLYDQNSHPLTPISRRKIDFDDLDPCYLADGRIVYASTRTPRVSIFGGYRVTNLWIMNPKGNKKQITFSLGSERRPYVLKDGRILFSYWSLTASQAANNSLDKSNNLAFITAFSKTQRQKELSILAKKCSLDNDTIIQNLSGHPPNNWWPALVNPDGSDFRAMSKPALSAFGARPLFNSKLVYLGADTDNPNELPRHRTLKQCPAGLIAHASGGRLGPLKDFPQALDETTSGPEFNAKAVHIGLPSALPPNKVIFPLTNFSPNYIASSIQVCSDNWPAEKLQENLKGKEIYQIEGYVIEDAQAIYPRKVLNKPDIEKEAKFGSNGGISSPSIYLNPVANAPGQKSNANQEPLYFPPPKDLVKAIEIYAVEVIRDKNNLATNQYQLKKTAIAQVRQANGSFEAVLPSNKLLMQRGVTASGKLATWTNETRDKQGRKATMTAFSGDHFGWSSPGIGHNFCVGCHAGHTVMPASDIADIIAN